MGYSPQALSVIQTFFGNKLLPYLPLSNIIEFQLFGVPDVNLHYIDFVLNIVHYT